MPVITSSTHQPVTHCCHHSVADQAPLIRNASALLCTYCNPSIRGSTLSGKDQGLYNLTGLDLDPELNYHHLNSSCALSSSFSLTVSLWWLNTCKKHLGENMKVVRAIPGICKCSINAKSSCSNSSHILIPSWRLPLSTLSIIMPAQGPDPHGSHHAALHMSYIFT